MRELYFPVYFFVWLGFFFFFFTMCTLFPSLPFPPSVFFTQAPSVSEVQPGMRTIHPYGQILSLGLGTWEAKGA